MGSNLGRLVGRIVALALTLRVVEGLDVRVGAVRHDAVGVVLLMAVEVVFAEMLV
jgi:hypothetical protein